MFNVVDQHAEVYEEEAPRQEEIIVTASTQYKKPAFSVENPQNTFITVEKVVHD